MPAPTVTCPTCGRCHAWDPDHRWRPFCSERCKLIDLGEWMSERRAIPGEAAAQPEGPEKAH